MKALSLTQPWATLIAIGAKRVETRSWSTNFRGELAIHVAKGFPKWAKDECFSPVFWKHLWPDLIPTALPVLTPATKIAERVALLPLGAIIGTAKLTTVGTTTAAVKAGLSAEQMAFGDFSAGRFAWFFNSVKKLREPIPCKGALGLWEVPTIIEAELLTAEFTER